MIHDNAHVSINSKRHCILRVLFETRTDQLLHELCVFVFLLSLLGSRNTWRLSWAFMTSCCVFALPLFDLPWTIPKPHRETSVFLFFHISFTSVCYLSVCWYELMPALPGVVEMCTILVSYTRTVWYVTLLRNLRILSLLSWISSGGIWYWPNTHRRLGEYKSV